LGAVGLGETRKEGDVYGPLAWKRYNGRLFNGKKKGRGTYPRVGGERVERNHYGTKSSRCNVGFILSHIFHQKRIRGGEMLGKEKEKEGEMGEKEFG